MKAMVLAAGLGTRLRPWTLSHPKALVPVGGVPMLERVIRKLADSGFDKIVVNIHHFGEQIIDFLSNNDFGVDIQISDERENLLDTGGGILNAQKMLIGDGEPVLIHNVDILSNADLSGLMSAHKKSEADATLLVSNRNSSRKLIFSSQMKLCGWHDLRNDCYRPENFVADQSCEEYAFSGIHVVSEKMIMSMAEEGFSGAFPIMDFYLSTACKYLFKGYCCHDLKLIDIGKPETLSRAVDFV